MPHVSWGRYMSVYYKLLLLSDKLKYHRILFLRRRSHRLNSGNFFFFFFEMKDYNTSIKTKTAGPTQLTNFKIPSYRHVIITLRKITSYACSTVQEFGRLEYIIKPVAMKSKKKNWPSK